MSPPLQAFSRVLANQALDDSGRDLHGLHQPKFELSGTFVGAVLVLVPRTTLAVRVSAPPQ